jgi:hypothetical protein
MKINCSGITKNFAKNHDHKRTYLEVKSSVTNSPLDKGVGGLTKKA